MNELMEKLSNFIRSEIALYIAIEKSNSMGAIQYLESKVQAHLAEIDFLKEELEKAKEEVKNIRGDSNE